VKRPVKALLPILASGTAALPILHCPACWPLYAGILSALGVGVVDYTRFLMPVTAGLLAISLIPLGWKAGQRRGYFPLMSGIAASLLILGGKFYFSMAWVFYAGIIMLLGASLWNLWPTQKACSTCGEDEKAK